MVTFSDEKPNYIYDHIYDFVYVYVLPKIMNNGGDLIIQVNYPPSPNRYKLPF